MSLKNNSKEPKSQGVWERERQKALQTQWILIGAIIGLVIVVFGIGGARAYPVLVAAVNATRTPTPTPTTQLVTERPTVSTPAPTTPVPTANTPMPTSESPTATPTETWTPTPVPVSATPTATPTPSSTPTPSATPQPIDSPTPIEGVVGGLGVQLFDYPTGTKRIDDFEWNRSGKYTENGISSLLPGTRVYLCFKMVDPNVEERYGISDEPCNSGKDPVGLALVVRFSSPAKEDFPTSLITPAPSPTSVSSEDESSDDS